MEDNQTTAVTLPDEQTFKRDIAAINQFQLVVQKSLIEGHDFGVIPGTQKPTLLKPGAEKIAKLLGLADLYAILDKQEDWEKGFFRYVIKCSLVSVRLNVTVSEGLGECNSMESKYRWREAQRVCPKCGVEAIIKGKAEFGGGWICFKKKGGCGAKFDDNDSAITSQSAGRVANDDIYSQVNTILKMSKKRALVDAALSAGRLSDLFTQDMEDIAQYKPVEPEPSSLKPASSRSADSPITEFWNACKTAGYNLKKKEGVDSIKAWLTKNLNTSLPFEQLSGELQKKAVELMKAEKKEELPF